MKTFARVVTMVMILIGIFLFVSRGDTTVKIIKELGGTANESIRNLQGR